MNKEKKFKGKKICKHKNIKILKSFRGTWPFGRKGKWRANSKPRKCTKLCLDCGKKLESWKP